MPRFYKIKKIDQIRNSLTELTLMQVLGATSECLIDEAENFQTRKYVGLDSFDHQIKTNVRKSDSFFQVIMFFFANQKQSLNLCTLDQRE